ncbi:MAG: hypothetical protein CMJ32_00120 [Phycisphaerae bacterium]|nr:hypothetical protein [Phycisphaerae bacterium]
MSRTALYRHYNRDGCLLYVGVTDDLSARTEAHERGSDWFASVARTDIQWCLSREHALALEAVAIVHEKPAHNRAHSGRADGASVECWRDLDRVIRAAAVAAGCTPDTLVRKINGDPRDYQRLLHKAMDVDNALQFIAAREVSA